LEVERVIGQALGGAPDCFPGLTRSRDFSPQWREGMKPTPEHCLPWLEGFVSKQ